MSVAIESLKLLVLLLLSIARVLISIDAMLTVKVVFLTWSFLLNQKNVAMFPQYQQVQCLARVVRAPTR